MKYTALEAYKKFITMGTLWSDSYMRLFLKDQPEVVGNMIRIITGIEPVEILESRIQEPISKLDSRGIICDVKAKDVNGSIFNVEIQKSVDKNIRYRARYCHSMLDVDSLQKGHDFEELPLTYVIFITDWDVFGLGKDAYFGQIQFSGIPSYMSFDDSVTVYVNGRYPSTDTEIGKLVHDIRTSNPDDMLLDFYRKRTIEMHEEGEMNMINDADLMLMCAVHGLDFEETRDKLREANRLNTIVQKLKSDSRHMSESELRKFIDSLPS